MAEAKKTIRNIEAYDVPLFDDYDCLRLNGNENDWGASPLVIDALRNVEAKDIRYYPCYGELIEKIAQYNGVKPENITVTAGADEAISAIFNTFLECGSTVLTVTPSFVMPRLYSQLCGLNYKEVDYQKKWEFPVDEITENIDIADLIHLTTPNSPTGDVIARTDIEKIIASGKKVLIDETYSNYADFKNTDLFGENVFVVRSFSKDFALAGLRLGYVISTPENIVSLRKYLSPYNVSSLTVKAGIAALSDVEYFECVKKEMEISKAELSQGFENIGAIVYPSHTNFIYVELGEKADMVYEKLINNNIKVKFYRQENAFRIGIPRLENTKKVLDVINNL